MTLPTWETQFKPLSDTGWSIREGQKTLAEAFSYALDNRGSVIGEAQTGTGKSLAAAIPMIHKIKEAKACNKSFRGIISTETITLQDQIVGKDLPMLQVIYKDFTFAKLMGRSNYLCLASAHQNTAQLADNALNNYYMRLEKGSQRLVTGDRSEVEDFLGTKLTTFQWNALSGSTDFCAIENKCTHTDPCFSSKARAKALAADIVVCNHAILATDVEVKINNASSGMNVDGLLGAYNALVVDEGHRLIPVFTSSFTKEVTSWEIYNMGLDVIRGVEQAQKLDPIPVIEVQGYIENIQTAVKKSIDYFSADVDEWHGHEAPLVFRSFSNNSSQRTKDIMLDYEKNVVRLLEEAITGLDSVKRRLARALGSSSGSKWAKAKKAVKKAVKLIEACTIIRESLLSTKGIAKNYGIFGVTIRGWEKRETLEKSAVISLEPLDVAPQLRSLWKEADTCLLMSATLADPTHKDPFKFIQVASGFPDTSKIVVAKSPFDFNDQQRVYVTDSSRSVLENTRYSFDELHRLIMASQGRSLVLFTSRRELDEAAARLRILQSSGNMPYTLYVQEKDCDKKLLAQHFKEDIHSVLLGLDSFMTGFDAPGQTLSQVILCKFPNPRNNPQMKQKTYYWKTRGFPSYYSRAALEKFIQAGGRLIRSMDCKGVFSIIDQAVADEKSLVNRTASLGIKQINSPIIQKIEEVGEFING